MGAYRWEAALSVISESDTNEQKSYYFSTAEGAKKVINRSMADTQVFGDGVSEWVNWIALAAEEYKVAAASSLIFCVTIFLYWISWKTMTDEDEMALRLLSPDRKQKKLNKSNNQSAQRFTADKLMVNSKSKDVNKKPVKKEGTQKKDVKTDESNTTNGDEKPTQSEGKIRIKLEQGKTEDKKDKKATASDVSKNAKVDEKAKETIKVADRKINKIEDKKDKATASDASKNAKGVERPIKTEGNNWITVEKGRTSKAVDKVRATDKTNQARTATKEKQTKPSSEKVVNPPGKNANPPVKNDNPSDDKKPSRESTNAASETKSVKTVIGLNWVKSETKE